MKTLACITVLLAAGLAMGGASTPAPSTQPGHPAPIVQLSPSGWLHVYNDAMRTGDKDDLRARLAATTEQAMKLADVIAEEDAAVGKALKATAGKLDEKSAHLIGQTIGDVGNDDLKEATETVDGDRATVTAQDKIPTPMVRENQQWKIDLDEVAANTVRQFGSIDLLVMSAQMRTAAANDLVRAIDAGEVKTVDDAISVIREGMSR